MSLPRGGRDSWTQGAEVEVGRLGTDLVSVACMLGGAGAAVGLTCLALRGADVVEERVDVACAVDASAPNVVVALGDGRVHVQSAPVMVQVGDCAHQEHAEVRIQMNGLRAEMERAQVEMQRARHEMERERFRVIRLEQIDEAALEAMAEELAQQAALLELKELDLEGELAKELQALERDLELRVTGVRPPGGGR